MRFVAGMLLLLVLVLVAQGIYYKQQTSAALSKALGHLPQDPHAGYAAIKPVFGYSNFTSLGAARAAREQFFNELRDKAIEGIRKPNPDPAAFSNLLQALIVLADAGKMPEFKLQGHSTAVLAAVREAEPQYRSSGSLVAWDAMVASLGRAFTEGAVPTNADFESWIESLKRVDRWQIGLREARAVAAAQLAAAASQLGKTPPASAADSAVALLDQPLNDGATIALDQTFGAALQYTDQLRSTFQLKEYPPELLAIRAKFELNIAALRAAHLVQLRAAGGEMMSGYMAKTVVNPTVDTLPSEGEIHGAYMNAVSGAIQQAEAAQAIAGFTPEENLLYRMLAARLGAVYWSFIGDGARSARSAGQYQALRTAALANPSTAASAAALESGQSPGVFIR